MPPKGEKANPYATVRKAGETNKRISLTDTLDRVRQTGTQFEVFDRLADDNKRYRGFRHHAPKTIQRQNSHLAIYTAHACARINKQPSDFNNGDLDEVRFPSDNFEKLYDQVREFLIWIYAAANPRSRATGEHIAYRSLVHYRDSLMYWIKRTFRLRKKRPPPTAELWHEMAEAMRAVLDEYKPEVPTMRPRRSWLGLGELRQLFDYEMLHNRCIENSEQHMAAWCIERMTSCRSGSMCPSGRHGRAKPLTWRNLTITKGDEPGMFDCVVLFENIYIKRPNDPETGGETAGYEELPVDLVCPDAANIIFSATHRLLVIAIRRGLLKDITTIDELLAYQGHEILIKDEHLDDPLFYRSTPKGTAIDKTAPLTAAALTAYLKARGVALGYTQGIAMHAIRRRAATDLVARVGTEAARRLLGHAPESRTLERYYMQMGSLFETTAAALNQPLESSTGYNAKLIEKWSPLATGRLTDEQARKTRGLALQAMTTKLILADENPPDDDWSPDQIKQYRKRQRAYAQQALIEEQTKLAKGQLSHADFKARQAELNSSKFASAVVERALALSKARGQPTTDVDDPDDDEETLFVQDAEDDLDNAAQQYVNEGAGHKTIRMQLDGDVEIEAAGNDQVQDLPYADLANSFMQTLFDNSLTTYKKWAERDQTCPECLGDETVSVIERVKKYQSEIHLNNHLEGSFHTPIAKWNRTSEALRKQHEDQLYVCQYCIGSGKSEAEAEKYTALKDLREHIKTSSAEVDGESHDRLKEEDGWYSDDFAPGPSEQTLIKRAQAGRKNLQNLGFKVNNPRQIIGTEPFAGFEGVVRGGGDRPMPARFANVLVEGPPPTPSARQMSQLATGTYSGPIPEDFKAHLISTQNPIPTPYPRNVSHPQATDAAAMLPPDERDDRTQAMHDGDEENAAEPMDEDQDDGDNQDPGAADDSDIEMG
ncbi:hypothetical protein LTR17_024264 [Elasticomyces elasticus]|nr:hypothetical protein LTR17_024264 [Elasticomyces elasticus]